MKEKMSSPDGRPQISFAQVAGSALAAVSAAVVASFLGVGGTVIGAAVGSLFATVGSAMYAHSFRRAGAKLSETKALTVVARSRAGHGDPGPGDVPVIEPATDDGERGPSPAYAESGPPGVMAEEVLQEAPARPKWMRWQTGVVLAVVAFVVAMFVVSVIELTIGGPISGGSGGTTVTKLVHPGSSRHVKKTPAPATATTTPPSVTPSSTPPTTGPSSTPTGTPTSTPTSTPTDTATATAPVGTPTG